MGAPDSLRSKPNEEAQRLFARLADSDVFKSAPVMRALLVYLWEHQGESVSEYAIAVHALGRPLDFDSKVDATVRVHISRLRNKFREFYERNSEFPLRLNIPRGGHELEWTFQDHEPEAAPASPPLEPLPRRYRKILIGTVSLAAFFLVACILLLLEIGHLKSSSPAAQERLPRFWQSFLLRGRPPVIVVPSPVYFRWSNNNIVVRDFAVSEFSNWQQSEVLRQLSANWGPPTLDQVYVSVLDMEAGISLQHYLERGGLQVQLTESRNFSMQSAMAGTTIFLGIPRTTEYLRQLFEKTNFYYSTLDNKAIIRNRKPKAGEPAEYQQVDYSAGHKIYPELVVQLPFRPDGGHTLILFGVMPMALASLLESRAGLQDLDGLWQKAGSPESWEMVVQAEMNGENVLKVRPTSIRAIPADFWK